MPRKAQSKHSRKPTAAKPGSSAEDAQAVGGTGDFGVPAAPQRTADRDYVSANTKASDPGAAHPRSGDTDGQRVSGVGAEDNGPGSGSGGDIDTDFTGVGTGGSTIAASGIINRPPGPDDDDNSADAPTKAKAPRSSRKNAGPPKMRGSTVVRPDVSAGGSAQSNDAQGADGATNAARDDDSFAGEISSGEAMGDDNADAPSSDSQGLNDDDNEQSS